MPRLRSYGHIGVRRFRRFKEAPRRVRNHAWKPLRAFTGSPIDETNVSRPDLPLDVVMNIIREHNARVRSNRSYARACVHSKY